MGQVLSAETDAQRRLRLKALWQLWEQNDPSLQQADSIQFYRSTLSTIPEQWRANPVRRELVLELKL